jgi:hypothetical protein
MNRARESQPARVVKRADVRVEPAFAGTQPMTDDDRDASTLPAAASAPRARHVPKEARLVSGAPGGATVEVRCSCGEWTRVELAIGGRAEGVER